MKDVGTVKRVDGFIIYQSRAGINRPGISEAVEDIESELENIVNGEEYHVVVMSEREYLARYNGGK